MKRIIVANFLQKKRLDYILPFLFIDIEAKKNAINVSRPPPIPPRQTKSDDKSTTPPPLVLNKQSHPTISSLIDTNDVNPIKGLFCQRINSLTKTNK